MNRATIVSVVVALAAATGAWSMRPKELPTVTFEDTGELLFPDFADPTLATSLEVVTWDEEASEVRRFAVEQKEGRWVIPSHNDYPADGTERMAKAAASFIDVKKDVYLGDNPEDFGAYGVIDPTSEDGKGDEKGKRITIEDAAGTVLVDIIVGKAIPAKQGMYYVRYPDEKRVYGSRLTLDVSTDFGDWIEKDLLHVKADEIVTLSYDPYHVDEAQGKVIGRDPVFADLEVDDAGKKEWKADPRIKVPKGKVLDSAKIRQMVSSIANVKIVGVRPRPPLDQLSPLAMQAKGFFVTPDGRRLFGNEGEVSAVTKDGVIYTLFFGEITYESGLALTAGNGEDAGAPAEGEEGESKAANRYMFVNISYDPSLDKTKADASTTEGDTDGATPPEPEPEKPEGEEDEGPKGPERAAQLRQRFDQWFYVISDTSFKQIHKARDDLFKDAPEEKDKKD